MPKLVTWMNNQRVGELTKLANGAHTFKYAPEWLASRYARPLSLSLPLQRGNITSDAVFNFFDNLLPDSPIVRDRIVKRYHAKSRQPFDLLSEIGRNSVGAVTLIPEDETVTHPIMAWEKLTEARLEEVLTAYKADIPLGMIREENDFRISVAGAQVIDSRHFTTSFQHFRSLAVREYTSAISNWQWGLTHPKAKKRQSIKFIRDIFWRQQRC